MTSERAASIREHELGPWRVWEARARAPLERAELEQLWKAAPARFLRRMPGRESFEWQLDGARVLVKRLAGGEPRDWWSERARGLALRSPARREAENLLALAADGLPVPRPLVWAEQRGARWQAWRGRAPSLLALEFVEHADTLEQRLARAPAAERRALLAEGARLAARLFAAGWCHRDLYLEHVLLELPGERLVLIDGGRARRYARLGERWRVKDLAGLLSSCPASLTRAERWRFLRAVAGDAARALAPAIAAKAERIRAHAPRHRFDRAQQELRSR